MSDGNPCHVDTLLSKALSAANSSMWEIAENTCHEIISAYPDQHDAIYMLGLINQNTGNTELAISYYKKALVLTGGHADAYNNLGTIHESSGNISEARSNYKKAVQCDASHFMANYNLGRIARLTGDPDTALTSLKAALASESESVPVLLELGLTLKNIGLIPEALSYLVIARELSPYDPVIQNIIGNTYQQNGKLQQAISCYLSAIQLKPSFAEAQNNLGSAYIARGDTCAGLQSYRKAIDIRPDWNGAISNHLLAENYVSSNPEELFNKHTRWGDAVTTIPPTCQTGPNPYTHGKIKIGYVSADFRAHSVSWFLMAIMQNYNHDAFHVTCFSDTAAPDKVTQNIRSLVDGWINISGVADNHVYQQIRENNIDILIDLAGHTANNRLGVFAMQASPVQVSYLGYPNTTGLKTIKYRITDNIADPEGDADILHTEKLVRLPECFLSYTPVANSPECTPLPCIINSYITFGSFNVLAKISDDCIKTWSIILNKVHDSRLILKSAGLDDAGTRIFISDRFRHHGVDPERIEMIPRTSSIRSHLQIYSQVDISLDTFPYNGTTTTCESLWMGVPVISLTGNRHAGRVGHSILFQTGLGELVAGDIEQYIYIAGNLAEDTAQLRTYRETIRGQMENSPLCDGIKFTRSLEKELTGMV